MVTPFFYLDYVYPARTGWKDILFVPKEIDMRYCELYVGIWEQVRATLRLLQDHMSGASYGVPRFHMERSWVNKVLPVSFRVWCFVAGSNKHGYLRRIIGAAEI